MTNRIFLLFLICMIATIFFVAEVHCGEAKGTQEDVRLINSILQGKSSQKIDIVSNPDCRCGLVTYINGEEIEGMDITKDMGKVQHLYEQGENIVRLEYSEQFKKKLQDAGEIVFFEDAEESLPNEMIEELKRWNERNNSGIALDLQFFGDEIQGQQVADALRRIISHCSTQHARVKRTAKKKKN